VIAVVFLPILLFFLAITIIVAAFLLLRIRRSMNRSAPNPPLLETQQQPIREEIVKKEVIVKVRCSYCDNQFDETLDKCPHCGAKH
jgi:hypothetical protein